MALKIYSTLLGIILFASCKNVPKEASMQSNNDSSYFHHQIDTVIKDLRYSPWQITIGAQKKEDSLEKVNPNEFARHIMKKLVYCNCLDKSLALDSFFKSNDVSKGLLQTEYLTYPNDIFDSVRKIITPIVIKFNLHRNSLNAKSYSIFCLDLYESVFLDSLVKSYDSKILTNKQE